MAIQSVRTLANRFWSKVSIKGPDDCWFWTASFTQHGYGQFYGANGRMVGAHRQAFILTSGPIPDSLHILHNCDNRPCCNPKHLFSGTNLDNIQDAQRKGRLLGRGRKYVTEQERILARKKSVQKYKSSPKGKVSNARWNRSVRGKATVRRYQEKISNGKN